MSTIFCDHLRKIVECYDDDIADKIRSKSNHLSDLRIMYDIMRAHQLKMNLTKSFLRVSFDKFVGIIFISKGIHLDPNKVKDIQSIQSPRTLKKLKGLYKALTYIRRFITNLSGHCLSFTWLMKKGVSFVWVEACQKAFEDVKEYLTKPPVLAATVLGKSFLLYVHNLWTIL